MRIVIVGNFGLNQKMTMAARALPLARELAHRGHALTMLLPAESSSGQPAPGADAVRLSFVGPPSASFLGQLWLGLRMVWRALRLRPHVLYVFKPIAYSGLALLAFWALRKIGLIHTILALDTDDWEGSGGWVDREPGPWWQRRLIIWQEQWCLAHADVITAASRELEQLTSARHRQVIYAPNAASTASPGWMPGDGRRVREALGLSDAPLVLAYTRFIEFSPERLADLFVEVRSRVPEAHFLVIGTGLRGEEAHFAALVRARGIESAVHSLGWVSRCELPDYFAAADVAAYLLDDTRLNRAKCLMKLVDLVLAGVPVVADAVGQACEYIADGETGSLVPPGATETMADRVATLLRDPAARRRLGQAARARMLVSWNWEGQAAVIGRALESVRPGLAHHEAS